MTRQAVQCIPFREFDTGYLIDAEFLLAAHLANQFIEEVPVSSYYDSQPGSAVEPFSFGLKAVWFTFTHYLGLRTVKRYPDGSVSE